MINVVPFIGWLISAIAWWSLSVPFWYCWTSCGIGAKYGYFLPAAFQSIPFWDCVMLGTCISILKLAIVPKLTYPNLSSRSSKSDT